MYLTSKIGIHWLFSITFKCRNSQRYRPPYVSVVSHHHNGNRLTFIMKNSIVYYLSFNSKLDIAKEPMSNHTSYHVSTSYDNFEIKAVIGMHNGSNCFPNSYVLNAQHAPRLNVLRAYLSYIANKRTFKRADININVFPMSEPSIML